MLFTNQLFLPFFSLVFVIHFIIPHRFRWIVLLSASYLFYGFLDLRFPVFLVIITFSVYLTGRFLGSKKKKGKNILFSGLLIPLGALIYFKYTGFFLKILKDILGPGVISADFNSFSIILPIGISFYVFKVISYLVDVYHEKIKAEKHFGYFALYVSFFPQLLAGPIERSTTFLPELKRKADFKLEEFGDGLRLFLWGLIKKLVVADNLARFVNQVFSDPESYAGLNLIMGAVFFSFQIYCDFSGYSDMAIGLGRVLGYRTKDNFNFPYFSKSVGQFWNRWHISLSSWLRDYIFLPLAYSYMRKMERFPKIPLKLESQAYIWATMITMFIAGLWHGANWTFVAWGLLIGSFLALSYLTRKGRKFLIKKLQLKKIKKTRSVFRILFTFSAVTFAWIFFKASTISEAFIYLKNISFKIQSAGTGQMIYLSSIVFCFIIAENVIIRYQPWNWITRVPWPLRMAGYGFLLCILIILGVDNSNEFLYFRF